MAGGTFPTTAPTYVITGGTDTANGTAGGVGLSGLLNQFEVDVTALAAKMGTGSSTPTTGKVLRANGTNTSVWGAVDLTADVTGTLPVANGGTGTTSSTGSGAVVLASSPTIATPTIASFVNATHTHANAAGGGQLGTSAYQDASVTPAKRSGGFFVGTLTPSGTGNLATSGVGFTPKLVTFTILAANSGTTGTTGTGSMTTTSQFAQSTSVTSTGPAAARLISTAACIILVSATTGLATQTAAYVSMDADGFTVNFSVQNGTLVGYVAYG